MKLVSDPTFGGFLWEEGDIAYPRARPAAAGVIVKVGPSPIMGRVPDPIECRLDQSVLIRTPKGREYTCRGDLCESLELLIWDHAAKAQRHQDRLDKIRLSRVTLKVPD